MNRFRIAVHVQVHPAVARVGQSHVDPLPRLDVAAAERVGRPLHGAVGIDGVETVMRNGQNLPRQVILT